MARKSPAKKKSTPPLIAGRYQRVRSLGRGGGGAVYLVQDTLEGGRILALKMVEKAKGVDLALADLKNEFATLSLLQHPNLASVRDFGVTEKEMFFTSEWVDGKDFLDATLHADLNSTFQLVVQALRALDYLHQRGVLHLDLKPANLLVTDPDRTGELSVKLIDFGIARWKKHGRSQNAEVSGSPPYAAPEILMEQEPSPASDIYSLGMLLHQIFARRFPFSTQNPMEILMRQTFEDPLPIEKLDPALPPEFAELLRRMVARGPSARLPSARAVLDEINRCLGESFSLRSPRAPARILEESDFLFHPEWLVDLSARVSRKERVELAGPEGAGKTHLLERLKAQLQLKGISPLHFRDRDAWREFLPQLDPSDCRPLFLDWNEAPKEADLGNFSGAVLWTSRGATSGMSNGKTVILPPLNEKEVGEFLAAEIRVAPEGTAGIPPQALTPIDPGRLETILQALREEGALAWGSGGWNWQGESVTDVSALLERKARRDAEKKARVREFLVGSGLSLPGQVLEGMLGFEAGALRESLLAWTDEGWLRRESRNGVNYFSVGASSEEQAGEVGAAPEAVVRQLNSLYDEGKFSAGIAWVDQHLREAGGSPLPSAIVLAGARHLVSEGQAERALQLISGLSFSDTENQGLLLETRARAENLLARFDDAEASLAESEKNYRAAGDGRGLARVYNLRGVLSRAARSWGDAEENFQTAVSEATRAGDLYCAGLAQTNLALVYQDQGKVEEAYAGYHEAWNFARQRPHPFLLQSLYQKWINLLHHGGKSAEAEVACYEWMKLTILHRYRDQQAIALNYLSLIAGRKGHLELKQAYLDQAIGLLDGAKQPRFRAQLLVNRGYLHWSRDKFLPAQLDAEAALNMGRLWPEDRLLAWVYMLLGKVYRDRPKPDWEKSAEFFEKAHANIQKNQNLESLWEVEFNQGLLAKVRGDRDGAEKHLLAAKRALEDFTAKLPEELRASYLRDRKLESVVQEIESLATYPWGTADNKD
ncbi:MAG: serine/threonine protein kinase [Deltaproteobacteria bacterium]|nr:serine/threonine protein kinase [Deltaproteobacteria bacterium]